MKKSLAFTLILLLFFSVATGIVLANFASTNFTTQQPSIPAKDLSTSDSATNDWPMFRYSAANSGSSDNSTPITYDLLWTAPTLNDQFAVCIVGSSPAIVDGVVYLGSDDGYLYAFNASSGSQFWRVMIGGSSVSSPVVAGGIVYVRDWYGTDCALNASTGQMLWNTTLGWSYSSPAVVNGIYYARTSGMSQP